MARKKKSAAPSGPDADFLRLARERYERAVDFDRHNVDEALDDLKFRAGEQWPEDVKQKRTADERPCLTINQMPQFVRQVTGDIRLNRPAIRVQPADDDADTKIARYYSGLIRSIEHHSKAQSTVYARAADSSAACGIGHFRICTEYASDDGFDQEIRLKLIRNALGVVWDPMAQEITKEDATYCFVPEDIGREEFAARYPGKQMAEFESDQPGDYLEGWFTKDSVRVSEYWVKKPKKRRLALIDMAPPPAPVGPVAEFPEPVEPKQELHDLTDMTDAQVAALGTIARERDVDGFEVCQYIISGVEVLEGPTKWAGRYIPIIPVIGEEINVGEKIVRHGVVRYAKDPQRMYNYSRSMAVELTALAPKAPWLLTAEQIAGREALWKRANTASLPYLTYKHIPNVPAPSRVGPPLPQTAALQDIQLSADDMSRTTGIYPSSLGAKSNETSGKAIMARQREGDVGTFVYQDNLAVAIQYAGRQLVDLIPKIYDTERAVRILGEDDTEEVVVINKMLPGGIVTNDLSLGKYDVIVTTGPSFSTKRQEAAESMLEFIRANPQSAGLVMDLLAKNMDWPGADKIAERFKKMLPPQLTEEGDGENGQPAGPPQPPPPDPALELQAMEQETRRIEATTKLETAKLNAAKAQQDADNAHTQAMADKLPQAEMGDVVQAIAGMIRELQLGHQQTIDMMGRVAAIAAAPKRTDVMLADGRRVSGIQTPVLS